MANDPIIIDNTPNVVIKNPNVRFYLGVTLFILGLLSALAAMFYGFFPELVGEGEIPTRAIAFVNAAISLVANAFGLTVLIPNVPHKVR